MSERGITRRRSLQILAGAGAAMLCRCASEDRREGLSDANAAMGKLDVMPRGAGGKSDAAGLQRLSRGHARGGVFYVPPPGKTPARPLVLLLHGATGSGERILGRVQDQFADQAIIVAPDSRSHTWDIPDRPLGPDVRFINAALRHVFDSYAVDATRIAVAGFSDGASYALTLGVTNGDLFTHVLAFSPGFLAVKQLSRRRPKVFIAHGRDDEILPIDRCGRRIAAELRQSGYETVLREFDGGHELRPEIVREGASWWIKH